MELHSSLPKPIKNARRRSKERNLKKFKRMETVGHISSTYWSPFHSYYILFWISGSQESNASNGAQIGVETKKLWLFEDNCAKLSEMSCENFARCFAVAKPPFGTRVPFRSSTPSFCSCKMGCENVSTLQKCSLATKWSLVAKWPPSYESSCKSSPSSEITSKLQNQSSNLQNG